MSDYDSERDTPDKLASEDATCLSCAERDSILAEFNYDRGNKMLRCLGQRAAIAIAEEKKLTARISTLEAERAKLVEVAKGLVCPSCYNIECGIWECGLECGCSCHAILNREDRR